MNVIDEPTLSEVKAALAVLTSAIGYPHRRINCSVVWENGIQFHDDGKFVTSGDEKVAREIVIKGIRTRPFTE